MLRNDNDAHTDPVAQQAAAGGASPYPMLSPGRWCAARPDGEEAWFCMGEMLPDWAAQQFAEAAAAGRVSTDAQTGDLVLAPVSAKGKGKAGS